MAFMGLGDQPEIDFPDKSTTTLPAEDCLTMRKHLVPQAVLCSLFGSYIELSPPARVFTPSFGGSKVAKFGPFEKYKEKSSPFGELFYNSASCYFPRA